ncbi:hypothetical protein AB0N06_22635 [Streptomyces sp. NPDC051020]|uniref:hypothetical protein n=1 Tax=Streptomyces sp. NPDC051020 TaxID=3155409 RepID=UPI00343FA736
MIDMDAIMPTAIRHRVRTRPPRDLFGAKPLSARADCGATVTVRDRAASPPYDIFRTFSLISPDGVTLRGHDRSSGRQTGKGRLPTEND